MKCQLTRRSRADGLARGQAFGAGGVGNAFRFTPPLVAQKEHVNQALEILDEAIAEVMETVA